MMLPDEHCILCCIIYIRSKIDVGIANWKSSHCLCFPLGRLAVNMKLQGRLFHPSIVGTAPLPFEKNWLLLAVSLSSLLHVTESQHNLFLCFGSWNLWELSASMSRCSLSWVLWEWQPAKPWAPSLERKAGAEAQSACIAARTAGGRTGGYGCALHCYGSDILRLNVQSASGPSKMNHYRS